MSGGAVAAVVVMLVAMLGLAGCGPSVDLRDAWLPPTPVRTEVFSIHREVAFRYEDLAVKGWAPGDGSVVICRLADVVRIDVEGQVLSRVEYGLPPGASAENAGESVLLEPGAVLSSAHGGKSWLDATYRWVAVSPNGLEVAVGDTPRPRLPVSLGGVSGVWRDGRAVVAWIERSGELVFNEPQTGRTVRLAGERNQPLTYFWGWIADRADGRMVLVAEVKAASYQWGKPRMWVLDPRFDEGEVRKTETVIDRKMMTFAEKPQYLLYRPDEPREVVLHGGWQWPEGISYSLRVTDRVVSIRGAARGAAFVLPGPSLLGTTPDGKTAVVRVEQYLPGLEPGKPLKYSAGMSITVRVDGEVVARSEVIETNFGLFGPNALSLVVGSTPDGRQLCAYLVADRLVFFSIDPSVVRDLRNPLEEAAGRRAPAAGAAPGVSVAGAEPAPPAGGWWVAAFNGEQNVTDAGMLVGLRGRADLTVADVLREGEFFANADELRALRARLVQSDDLVWRDAPARLRGPAGQFRSLAEATVDTSTPSVADRLTGGATVEPTGRLQLVQPWEAGGKGTLLIRVVGGEDVFLAVPSTNRFIRWDRLLGTAVLCRGWDEVRRRFPAGPAGERSIWPAVSSADPSAPRSMYSLDVPGLLEEFAPGEVPAEWARE